MQPMLEPLEPRALLSGEIDTSFGTGGVTTTNFDGPFAPTERVNRVVVDRIGRVYVAGTLGGKALVARYTVAGALDTSFNGTGYVQVPVSGFTEATALAVRADGEIFLGGTTPTPARATMAAVVALSPDGSLDTSFNGDGVWSGYWSTPTTTTVSRVAGLVILGNTLYAGGGDTRTQAVAHFTSAGELDPNFGTGGIAARDFSTASVAPSLSAADFVLTSPPAGTPGLVVVSSNLSSNGGGSPYFTRFQVSGGVDGNFPAQPLYNTSDYPLRVNRVVVTPSGQLLVAGVAFQRGMVVRLLGSGAVDTAFGGVGTGFYTASTPQYTLTSVAALPDGQAIVIGPLTDTTTGVIALTAAGVPNNTYFAGAAGSLAVQTVADTAVGDDGKVVVAGRLSVGGGAYDSQVARLNAPGSPLEIDGSLFDDVNADGLANDIPTRTTFYGVSAYLDANNNGVFDPGEVTSYAGTGKFIFGNLAPGTYHVGLNIPSSLRLRQTYPAAGGTFAVTTGGTITFAGVFGVHTLPLSYHAIGYTFNDTNADGSENTYEERIEAVTIYDDVNGNGVLDTGDDSVVSSASGYFGIDLTPGNHTLRQIPLAGHRAVGQYLTTYVSGNTFAVDSVLRVPTDTMNNLLHFGSRPLTRVDGFAFNDLDGDGVQEAGEAITAGGGFVYADLNSNGVYDAGVDQTASAAPGSPGYFELLLGPGTYTLRQSLTGGWQQTLPAAGGARTITLSPNQNSLANVVFGRRLPPAPPATFTVSGIAFEDANRNKIADPAEIDHGGLDFWYVYVDTNQNGTLDDNDLYAAGTGSNGHYTLTLPADGRTYRVQLRNDDVGYRTFTTASFFDVSSTTGGQALAGRDFGLTPYAPGVFVSGTVYADTDRSGTKNVGEVGVKDVTVYIDTDNDKVLDSSENWTTTDSGGGFAFGDVPNTGPATRLRVVGPTGSTQTSPANGNGYSLNLASGARNTGKDFGLYTAPAGLTAALSGFAFDDTNKNGLYDSGETKTANKTVFLDLDGDSLLDANEKKTTTGANGAWGFTGLAAGTYHVRRVFPSGFTQSNALIDVTVTAGQTISNLWIGSKIGTSTPVNNASITGVAFNDANRNGVYDSGDTLTAGKTIWLDLDDDGVKDSGEASVVTDSAGKFAFTGLAARTYHVRRVFSSGYVESTPPRTISLTSGQTVTGVSIGSKTV